MSKVNNKAIFYAEQIIGARDALERVLVHYEEFTKDMSSEMLKDINENIERMHYALDQHHRNILDRKIEENLPY